MTKREKTARSKMLVQSIAARIGRIVSRNRQNNADYVYVGAMAAEYVELQGDKFDWKGFLAEHVSTLNVKTQYRVLNAGVVARVLFAALPVEDDEGNSAPFDYSATFDNAEDQADHDSRSPLAGSAYLSFVPLYTFLAENKSAELRDAGRAAVLRLWLAACERAADGVPLITDVQHVVGVETGKLNEDGTPVTGEESDEGESDKGESESDGEESEDRNTPTAGEGDENTSTVELNTANLAAAVQAVSDQISGLSAQLKIPAGDVFAVLEAGTRLCEEHSIAGAQAGLTAWAKGQTQ